MWQRSGPNTVRLFSFDSVLEALKFHGAGGAHGSGKPDSPFPCFLVGEVLGEENVGEILARSFVVGKCLR